MKEVRKPELIICAVGTLAMLFFFAKWWIEDTPGVFLSSIAACASMILFTLICLFAVCQLFASFRTPPAGVDTGETPRFAHLRVAALCLLSLVIHILIVSLIRVQDHRSDDIIKAISDAYRSLDTPHYFDIARVGYTTMEDGQVLNLVFFPGYPVVVGLLLLIIPNEMVCGLIASWVPFIIGCVVLYELLRLDYPHKTCMRVLLLLCLLPAAVFYSYPMSESIFLLWIAACLYCARTRRWFAASVWGMLAAFTRSAGVLILLPMGIEWLWQVIGDADRRKNRRAWLLNLLYMAIVPLGIALYLHINATVTGSPLTFLEYQRDHWHQSLNWFFTTTATQVSYAWNQFATKNTNFWGLWVPNIVVGFGSMALMLASIGKIRLSYTAWFIPYFFICYGASWLLSGPRYMTVFFPLAIALEVLPKHKWIAPVICGLLSVGYCFAFALRWGVW